MREREMPSPRPKVPPYLLMLVVSFALLGLIGYQTLKDRKVSGDLLKKKDSVIQEKVFAAQKLELLLQKEKKKSLDLQEKLDKLSSQKEKLNGIKDDLHGQLLQLGHAKQLTDKDKKRLESSLLDKENEVNELKEKLTLADEKEENLKVLKKEIAEKDAEINGLKAQIKALGGQVSDKLSAESTKAGGTPENEVEEKVSKQESNAGKGIGEKVSEVDEDREDFKEEETTDKHSKEQAETSKKTSGAQSMDIEDEESRVDDREDTLPNDDTGGEADAEKAHEDEDSDEQPDVDMDAVSKTDLDENELAAME